MISWYTVYDPQTGRIAAAFTADPDSAQANTPAGMERLVGRFDFRDGYISNGVFVAFPEQPSPQHVFDWDSHAWVDPRSLADLKAEKWVAIKAARDAAEFGGFTWDGSVFDSDLISQSRIQGATQLAGLAPMTFSLDWTLADNSVRTLNAMQMIAVGEALGAHVATQHSIGRSLRAAIEAATSAAELDAIAWPA